MIIKQDQDSIYVVADTILSGFVTKADTNQIRKDSLGNKAAKSDSMKLSRKSNDTVKNTAVVNASDSTTPRYIKAFHHVRIFSDSLQAVSDSLYYSGVDSVFRLFTDPIVWASGNQITGDTIFLYTKNKKADRLYVFENSLVVSKAGPNQYNQIKGNTLNGYFNEGTIDFMRAKGNAESIYYVKDEDSAYVGVNRSTADIIDMRFANKELNKVVYINDVKGLTTPFRQVKFDEMRLRNFKWLEARRPKTKYEMFGD